MAGVTWITSKIIYKCSW